jgi:rhamnosyltransferase
VTVLPSVTVTVLTWNGERYLESLLSSVEQQHFNGQVDLLVIDSGSTDRTLDIIAAHPQVRLHQIPNSEFGHGTTRNLAAELANGDIVVYLTHDAVPATPSWLSALVAPFVDDERIVAVLGKQVPRPSCVPIVKYDIQRVFERLGPDYGHTTFFDDGNLITDRDKEAAGFYSDANSAARRSVLLGPVPYQDVDYAEDQRFGRDVIEAGLRKAYAPGAVVEHSNDLTLRAFRQRMMDEVIGLRRLGTDIPALSVAGMLKQVVKWSAVDSGFILIDPQLSAGRKLGWLLANPVWHAVKWSSFRRATRIAL